MASILMQLVGNGFEMEGRMVLQRFGLNVQLTGWTEELEVAQENLYCRQRRFEALDGNC